MYRTGRFVIGSLSISHGDGIAYVLIKICLREGAWWIFAELNSTLIKLIQMPKPSVKRCFEVFLDPKPKSQNTGCVH
jgi:hypothetical protein